MLIPTPCYVSYVEIVKLAGGVPVLVPTNDDFSLNTENFRNAITPRTKLILLNSPNNPTGVVYSRASLEALGEIAEEKDLYVISDEVYEKLVYDGAEHVSIASVSGAMYERTVIVNGFSKAFAMTGWRMGYACAPKPILDVMLRVHQYTIMCAPTLGQYAALEALKSGFETDFADVKRMVTQYDRRRRVIVDGLRRAGLPTHEPLGAFYAFPCVKGTGLSSNEFCLRLLEEQRVACVPGDAFGRGGEGYVRCSYASSMENIREAVRRIGIFMQKYR